MDGIIQSSEYEQEHLIDQQQQKSNELFFHCCWLNTSFFLIYKIAKHQIHMKLNKTINKKNKTRFSDQIFFILLTIKYKRLFKHIWCFASLYQNIHILLVIFALFAKRMVQKCDSCHCSAKTLFSLSNSRHITLLFFHISHRQLLLQATGHQNSK